MCGVRHDVIGVRRDGAGARGGEVGAAAGLVVITLRAAFTGLPRPSPQTGAHKGRSYKWARRRGLFSYQSSMPVLPPPPFMKMGSDGVHESGEHWRRGPLPEWEWPRYSRGPGYRTSPVRRREDWPSYLLIKTSIVVPRAAAIRANAEAEPGFIPRSISER